MGVVGRKVTVAALTGQTSDTTTAAKRIVDPNASTFIARLKAHCNSGTPTVDVILYHAPLSDSPTQDWKPLVTFTQVTTETNNVEDVHINSMTTHVFPHVRAGIDVGGTNPNYDITVELWHDT